MCCLPLFAALDQLRLLGVKIATFGDFQQLPPHPESNSWRGQPVSPTSFKDSRLYKRWSDCTCFELTRCRRSDAQHFKFYTNLPEDLSKAVAKTKKYYSAPANLPEVDLHVCLSHWRRRQISLRKQTQAALGKECVEVPAGDDPAYPIFVGTRLVGNSTNGKFVNGTRYIVTQLLNNGKIMLEDAGKQIETNVDLVSKHCILAWALTYPKVQGITETGTIILHDCQSRHFKKCHLYVGLSRVTNGSNVFISQDKNVW